MQLPFRLSKRRYLRRSYKLSRQSGPLPAREHKTLSTLITLAIAQLDQTRRLAKILAEESVDSARQAWSQAFSLPSTRPRAR